MSCFSVSFVKTPNPKVQHFRTPEYRAYRQLVTALPHFEDLTNMLLQCLSYLACLLLGFISRRVRLVTLATDPPCFGIRWYKYVTMPENETDLPAITAPDHLAHVPGGLSIPVSPLLLSHTVSFAWCEAEIKVHQEVQGCIMHSPGPAHQLMMAMK